MKPTGFVLVGMLLLGFGRASPVVQGGAAAQAEEKVPARYSDPSSGKQMFRDYCAACHGMEGRGDGPVARFFLRTAPADLGALAQRNGGSTRLTKLPRRCAWARTAEHTGRLTCRHGGRCSRTGQENRFGFCGGGIHNLTEYVNATEKVTLKKHPAGEALTLRPLFTRHKRGATRQVPRYCTKARRSDRNGSRCTNAQR